MKIETKIITPKILLLIFNSRKDITSTLLRFQEYYESPEFRNKIFSLKEFKKWYTKNSPNGRKTGKFTYYEDWGGFNMPSYIFKPFKSGDFDPLSKNEKKILELVSNVKEPFYLIGIFMQHKKVKSLIDHELKHALYYTNKKYKEEVSEILSGCDLDEIKVKLGRMGYNEAVFADEIHAYATDKSSRLKDLIPKSVRKRLSEVFEKYKKAENISV